MKKNSFLKSFAALFLIIAMCLFPLATGQLFAQEGESAPKSEDEGTDDGRRMSREAQEALVEANRRLETNPDDLAAARETLVAYLAVPHEDPTPLMLYQMLGQLWYADDKSENHLEEARKIFKAGFADFPGNEQLLLNYAVTTYELERYEDAAPLFEKFYEISEAHEVKYLEYAAASYYTAENLKEAKRLFLRMIDLVDPPESRWLDSIISICQAMEDDKEVEKYTRLALNLYPMKKTYWNLMANVFYGKEDYKGAASVLEIATRVKAPEKATEWKSLVDLYTYLRLPLRIAQIKQEGFTLLAKNRAKTAVDERKKKTKKEVSAKQRKNIEEESEVAEQIEVAEAYASSGRVDKAVSYLDGLIAKKKSYDLLFTKATILYDARRNEEAMAALDDCIDMNARAYEAHWMKGWVAWDQKDWKIASDAFEEAGNSKVDQYRLGSKDALDMLASLDKAKSE